MTEMAIVMADKPTMLDLQDFLEPESEGENTYDTGIAAYEGLSATVVRSGTSLGLPVARKLTKGTAFLGLSQCGDANRPVSLEDSAPFQRELFGRLWTFVGKAQVSGIEGEESFRFKPIGRSLEEKVFCLLLDSLWYAAPQGGAITDIEKVVGLLKKRLRTIKNYGDVDFLMSDGEFVISYNDNDLFYKLADGNDIKYLTVMTKEPVDQTDWACLLPGTMAFLSADRVLGQSGIEGGDELATEAQDVFDDKCS